MDKRILTAAVEACKAETKDALQLVYDSLNTGQKNKLLKDPAVVALFERYGVVI